MKKHVLIATGLAVLSTSAFATKARMSALSQAPKTGSYYMGDTRNVFYNPAYVNTYKNYVVAEVGDGGTGNPNQEGGFFREAGAFNYGLYLGSDAYALTTDDTAFAGSTGDATLGATAELDSTSEMDLFFGGDAGLEWGARLHRASASTKVTGATEKKYDDLGLGLGVIMGDLEVYANMMLNMEAKEGAAGSKWEGKNLNAGVGYNWMGYKFFGNYAKTGADYTTGTGDTKDEGSSSIITVGAGHIKEVSATSRMNMDLSFKSQTDKEKIGGGVEDKETTTSLPLSVGFETDATSWLTVRGSVKQNFFLNNVKFEDKTGATTSTTETKGTESTSVAVGSSLNFGKFKVDMTIDSTASNAGKLNFTNFGSNVAVHYWF